LIHHKIKGEEPCYIDKAVDSHIHGSVHSPQNNMKPWTKKVTKINLARVLA